MDPVANLNAQLEAARAIFNCGTVPYLRDKKCELAEELAELVIALDEWRRSGGFDPYTVR
jgi:hypothetical protein